jgi:PIN domain nuclease of toxin-antitoxin system
LNQSSPLPVTFQQLAKNAIELLPIAINHLALITTLPMHHRDPFDRLLIAQAIAEQLSIVSIDDQFDPYGIKRLW